jgi:hypothetical protein
MDRRTPEANFVGKATAHGSDTTRVAFSDSLRFPEVKNTHGQKVTSQKFAEKVNDE